MKSNKSISQKTIFGPIQFFAVSKMAKNQFLNWGKSLKLPEMQFHEKIFDLFDFTSYFAWTFFNFLTRCAMVHFQIMKNSFKIIFSM